LNRLSRAHSVTDNRHTDGRATSNSERESSRSLKSAHFSRFVEKTTRYGEICKIRNSVPKCFIATPIDVLYANFVKVGRREIGKVVRYLPDKICCPALASARIAPKIRQPSAGQFTQRVKDFIEMGSHSAELQPNASTRSERAQK